MYNDPNQPPQPYQPPMEKWDQPSLPPTQYEVPSAYEPGQYAVPPQAQWQQPRRSRRGVWIALAIVGVVLVLGCGGCAAAAIAGVGFFANSLAGPTQAANNYYQAIKNRDYHQAFSYIDTSGISSQQDQQLTEDAYTVLAQTEDVASGPVTRFSQTNINVNSTNGVNTASVTMSVTRQSRGTYSVQLQLKEENGVWKITDYSNV